MTLSPIQTDIDRLLAPDILPTFSVASFVAKGATLAGAAISLTCPLTRLCLLKSRLFSPKPRKSSRGASCKTTAFGGKAGFDG